uniref:Uncharacterized protein n=1 Tax=Candidatus Kentrum sp. FW TaxID=2126338 RepID=A0A450TW37_9GAMM|nr:MAG: hypothetical protein BECKFW1821C_GA0114237_104711 [Candidatus Kentron sp. FW]
MCNLLSNEDLPLPIDNDDRRSQDRENQSEIFPWLYGWAHCPQSRFAFCVNKSRHLYATEALGSFLQRTVDGNSRRRHRGFLPLPAPSRFVELQSQVGTTRHRRQAGPCGSIQTKRRPVHRGVDGAGDTPYPFGPCGGKQLYLAYSRWCRANGVRYPRNAIQFLNRVGKMPGWLCSKDARFRIWDNTHYTGPRTQMRFVIPDQTQLALNKCGRPPGKDDLEWLTDCYVEFNRMLGKEANG